MHIDELLSPWINIDVPLCDVRGLKQDSREVVSQDLFFSYSGDSEHITDATARGAVGIIYDPMQTLPADLPSNIPCIAIADLRQHLGSIASRFYAYPSNDLTITGVTGTNGKTTIAYLLAQAHNLLGQSTAYIGTLGHGDILHLQPLANTTPGALVLQQLLAQYKQQYVTNICMEVSSHALSQDRVAGVKFDQAIYTNLTHDHLDYHQTMESYAAAKARLFNFQDLEWAIINLDDAYAEFMVSKSRAQCLTYGINNSAKLMAYDIELHANGSSFKVNSPWGIHNIVLQIPGLFNVYNALAICASLLVSNYSPDKIEAIMPQLQASPGRMEVVHTNPTIIIDYAHTPDALEKVLATLVHINKNGALWLVFGCGGERDVYKRPLMGAIASKYASNIILTNDNPRNEDPLAILQQIVQSIPKQVNTLRIPDRKEAINYAMLHAKVEDTILIAGKGHETYQDFGTHREIFSDHAVVRQYNR